MTKKYTLKQLEALPTLHQGHTDDLKIETHKGYPFKESKGVRVWLSRLTVEDGQPYNNQVTVEEYREKKISGFDSWQWVTVQQYQAK